jgi:hypothetical protein
MVQCGSATATKQSPGATLFPGDSEYADFAVKVSTQPLANDLPRSSMMQSTNSLTLGMSLINRTTLPQLDTTAASSANPT